MKDTVAAVQQGPLDGSSFASLAHKVLTEQCTELFGFNLIKQQDRWRATIAEMQKTMDQCISSCGCNPEDALQWKAHWDHQVRCLYIAPSR